MNSTARNIGVHVSFWIRVVSGYMPRSEIAESYSNFFLSLVYVIFIYFLFLLEYSCFTMLC